VSLTREINIVPDFCNAVFTGSLRRAVLTSEPAKENEAGVSLQPGTVSSTGSEVINEAVASH
jgi:hypothetical protein